MATVNEIFEIINEAYPVSLSDEYCKNFSHYDNSGIIVDCGEEVSGVLFSLDFSMKTISEAIKRNCNLIVTHHPAIYNANFNRILKNDTLGNKIIRTIKNGISVISMHLNADLASNGVDEMLMEAMGGKKEIATYETIEGGKYGRVYNVKEQMLFDFAMEGKANLSANKIEVFGENITIKTVASFCGAGVDNGAIDFAQKMGAEVIVSADIRYHTILEILERGMRVITYTHFATEDYGFEKIYSRLKEKLPVESSYFTDVIML